MSGRFSQFTEDERYILRSALTDQIDDIRERHQELVTGLRHKKENPELELLIDLYRKLRDEIALEGQ